MCVRDRERERSGGGILGEIDESMSVFGGDSWVPEAQSRKRRVDDLILQGIHASAYKKLCSGKFLCLICPHLPVLDTPLILSAHVKGSRHQVAEAKLKERELTREYEINKRRALADSSATICESANKPLIEQGQKAASEIRCSGSPMHESPAAGSNTCRHYKANLSIQRSAVAQVVTAPEEGLSQQLDPRDRRERELKFTAAGWKRDGHGGWFKDENVEFDSDEEDPNTCLF